MKEEFKNNFKSLQISKKDSNGNDLNETKIFVEEWLDGLSVRSGYCVGRLHQLLLLNGSKAKSVHDNMIEFVSFLKQASLEIQKELENAILLHDNFIEIIEHIQIYIPNFGGYNQWIHQLKDLIHLFECVICGSECMIEPVTIGCGHTFCKKCIGKWLKNEKSCPTCRQNLTYSFENTDISLPCNILLQSMIQTIYSERISMLKQEIENEELEILRSQIIEQKLNETRNGPLPVQLIRQNTIQLNTRITNHTENEENENISDDIEIQHRIIEQETRLLLKNEKRLRESTRRRYCQQPHTTISYRTFNGYPIPTTTLNQSTSSSTSSSHSGYHTSEKKKSIWKRLWVR